MIFWALCPLAAAAQSAAPAFEVASVKPTQHGRDATGNSSSSIGKQSPGRFAAQNSSLGFMIVFAYGLKEYQVIGPSWLTDDSVCFDIQAKAPPETTEKQMTVMLQTLLAERFHLSAHRETRTLPVYELVPAKGGPRLQKSAAEGTNSNLGSSDRGTMEGTNVPISLLAESLSDHVNRPVLDKTGIEGRFDLKLTYDPQENGGERPSIYTALEQQLGLRLQPAKAPVEVLVIDHIDRTPAAN